VVVVVVVVVVATVAVEKGWVEVNTPIVGFPRGKRRCPGGHGDVLRLL